MTGGSFYKVEDPNELPQIFIKEARVVSRSLIQEGRFVTGVLESSSGPIQGTMDVPSVDGYVLTAPRKSLAQIGLVVDNGEFQDPLYAWWNYGLGRVVAFTSDLKRSVDRPLASMVTILQLLGAGVIRWLMRSSLAERLSA